MTLGIGACGGPVDASGNWSINLTNGANSCMLDNWRAGETTSGIPLVISQTGSAITADVGGVYGAALDLYFGRRQFAGSVSGNRIDARLVGRPGSRGSCAFTPVLDLTGDISGDGIVGNVIWSFDTNSSPDCGMYATCENVQAMNGARPPSTGR